MKGDKGKYFFLASKFIFQILNCIKNKDVGRI